MLAMTRTGEPVTLRALRVDDLDVPSGLSSLRAEIAVELSSERGGPLFLADRDEPEWIVDTKSGSVIREPWHVRVAVVETGKGEALLGWAATFVRVLPNGVRVGSIEELGVHPEAREIGVGELLADDAVAYCRDAGCVGVDAAALPGARETKNFFETFGFTARLLTVHHRFRDQSEEDERSARRAERASRASDEH